MIRSLVTGGAGFIGSHLVEALLGRGDEVVVIDDLSTGRRENLAAVEGDPRFTFVEGTILNERLLEAAVSGTGRVFHLAAGVGVMLILERPVQTMETNIRGTELVLSAAARHGTPVFIASSSEVCGKGRGGPFREEDDMVLGATSRSRWSYAASKAVDEFLALAWHREVQLPVVVARFFNTIGPRQIGHYGMVVPRFIEQALSGEPITVYGDGRQSRAFAWVGDVVTAVIGLIETPAAYGRIFNVGSEEEVTIRELAEKVREQTESGSEIVHVPYEEAYEAGFEDLGRRVPDLSRIREAIGYRPTLDLTETLKRIIDEG